MPYLRYENIPQILQGIRRASPVIVGLVVILGCIYVYYAPRQLRELHVATVAMILAQLFSIYFLVQAAYERKYGLWAFITLVVVPSTSLAFNLFLEKQTGLPLPDRSPAVLLDLPTWMYAFFAACLAIGLLWGLRKRR